MANQERCAFFIINSLKRGGAEGQLVRIATGLRQLGWQIEILTLLPDNDFVDDLKYADIEVKLLNFRGTNAISILRALIEHLKIGKPKVLVTFSEHADILGRVAARLLSIPVISSYRNARVGSIGRSLLLFLLKWIPVLFSTNSYFATKHLARALQIVESRTVVIPNGINSPTPPGARTASQPDPIRAELGVPRDEFIWLAVGRLEPQKDYSTLLRAFQVLGMPGTLLICGAGKQEMELKSFAAELQLVHGAHIKFLGFRRDVSSLLDSCDALVLASQWEGMPNVVMEAMAHCKPVVATSVGGTPELVRDKETGFLVPPGDEVALSQAMKMLMKLPPCKRKRMGHKGRDIIDADYNVHAMVSAWDALLRRAIRLPLYKENVS